MAGEPRLSRRLGDLADDLLGDLFAIAFERRASYGAELADARPWLKVVSTWTLDVLDGRVQGIRAVLNPDKLRHVGPVADPWTVFREANEARRTMH